MSALTVLRLPATRDAQLGGAQVKARRWIEAKRTDDGPFWRLLSMACDDALVGGRLDHAFEKLITFGLRYLVYLREHQIEEARAFDRRVVKDYQRYVASLRTMAAAQLHPTIAPAAQNALGYAFICLGDMRAAADELASAREAAVRTGNATMAQFAEYNLAIVDELDGNIARSRGRLQHLRDVPQPARREFDHWVELRLMWLAIRVGDAASARVDSSGYAVRRARLTSRTRRCNWRR